MLESEDSDFSKILESKPGQIVVIARNLFFLARNLKFTEWTRHIVKEPSLQRFYNTHHNYVRF